MRQPRRELRQGRIEAFVAGPRGKVGTLVEVACDTDFVAMNKDFIGFVRQCAEQLAADPQALAEGGALDQRRAELARLVGERIVIRRAVRYALPDADGPGPGGLGVREPRHPAPDDDAAQAEAFTDDSG